MVDPVPGFRTAQVAEPGSYREGMPTMDGRDYVSQGCWRGHGGSAVATREPVFDIQCAYKELNLVLTPIFARDNHE